MLQFFARDGKVSGMYHCLLLGCVCSTWLSNAVVNKQFCCQAQPPACESFGDLMCHGF